ncbi:MAG: 2Fe-2S iron-sulfur cluster-binding protein [Pontibacterium sp.]
MNKNKKHTITVINRDTQYTCAEDTNLLVGMEKKAQSCVPVGCRCGGCGVCLVKVVSGDYEKKVMSKAHICEQKLSDDIVLACRIFPRSDMKVEALLDKFCKPKPNEN